MNKTTKNNEKINLTKQEVRQKRRGIFLQVSAFLLAFILQIIGMLVKVRTGNSLVNIARILVIAGYTLALLLFPLNFFLTKQYLKKFKQMKVEEIQHYLLRHRESAENVAQQKFKFIQKCRFWTDLYAIFFCVLAIVTAFCSGILYNTSGVVYIMSSGLLFLASFTRIRFKIIKERNLNFSITIECFSGFFN